MKKIFYSLFAVVTMVCAVECSSQTVSGKKGGHDYVDLGLPSGRLWATYNVGASKPTEYGDYFAWGELTPKNNYSWETYKWSKDGGIFIKYGIRGNPVFDGKTVLEASDDAATVNWGAGWRMPTTTEQQELIDGCNWEWTGNFKGSGVAGRIGTSKTNGNTIFLPAAGYRLGTDLYGAGDGGSYWSSSLVMHEPFVDSWQYSSIVYNLYFCSVYIDYQLSADRICGLSVRAVVNSAQQEESQDARKTDSTNTNVPTDTTESNIASDTTGTTAHGVTVSGKVGNYTYVELGLASGTKWATYNVGASKPTEYGDYFAWGETTPKESYHYTNYKLSKDSCDTYTKYVAGSSYGTVDSLTTLLAEDDAATANWGAGWRMPTKAEQEELLDGCDWEWTDNFNGSGIAGRIGTSKNNGSTIFLPAAGNRFGTDLYDAGRGYYWSSSLSAGSLDSFWSSFLHEGLSDYAYYLGFGSYYINWSTNYRHYGQTVRAVVK